VTSRDVSWGELVDGKVHDGNCDGLLQRTEADCGERWSGGLEPDMSACMAQFIDDDRTKPPF